MAGTTTNMGLATWNLLTDFFSHTDLLNNWTKVDAHNHVPVASGGAGGTPIPGAGIQNGAITNPKLASNSVATANVQDNAITTSKVPDSAITYQKLAPGPGSIGVGAFSAGASTASYASGSTLIFDSETLDESNWYDNTTGIFTPQITAWWDISWAVGIQPSQLAAGQYCAALMSVNGLTQPWSNIVYQPSTITLDEGHIMQGRFFGHSTAGATAFAVRLQHNKGSAITLAASTNINRFFARLLTT